MRIYVCKNREDDHCSRVSQWQTLVRRGLERKNWRSAPQVSSFELDKSWLFIARRVIAHRRAE